MEQYKNDLNGLTELLTAGVSPLHTIRHSMNLLESRGFTELSLDKGLGLRAWKGLLCQCLRHYSHRFHRGRGRGGAPKLPHRLLPYRLALPDGKAVSGNLCRGVRKAECGSLRRSDFKHLA